jgi:glucoamylase
VSQKKVFDMPYHTINRYIKNKNVSKFDIWRFTLPCPYITKGNTLRIITAVSATVSWSCDNWKNVQKIDSIDGGFGVHYTDVAVGAVDSESVVFTFFWIDAQHWENKNYEIKIV